MKLLNAMLIVGLAGLAIVIGTISCAGTPVAGSVLGHQVRRFHDDSLKVTCWTVFGEGAISCIPDKDLR